MIKTLRIKNFQSHKSTTFEFSPGVNIIVGETDSGKTAAIRSLLWAIYNRPSGEAFRSYWGGVTEVEATLGTGTVIRRTRSENQNSYTINNVINLQAMGTGVPDKIAKEFNISEVNLQQQLDSPFLLSETPGKVASIFNQVARLDKIDKSIQNVQKQIRDKTALIKFNKAEQENLEEALLEFSDLEKQEKQLEEIEYLLKRSKKLKREKIKIDTLLTMIQEIDLEIEKCTEIISNEDLINEILKLYEEKDSNSSNIMKLQSILDRIYSFDRNIALIQKKTQQEQIVVDLLQLTKEEEAISIDILNIRTLVYKLKVIDATIEKTQEKLNTFEDMWHKEFPDKCPLCGK